MHDKIEFICQFDGEITDGLQQKLKEIAENHIEKFSESYFKKFLQNDDAQGRITMYISKNKQEKYEGKFHFLIDTYNFHRQNDVPFKEPLDIVNHAFKRLKEDIATQ